uniref:Tr-type G domain-containing protein n=1 Tax=Glossina morsitans morsitans TaxID=37546 RepID=A0A1B0FDH4_GLOMM
MIVNINIGLLGHVDSGKTSLAKALSTISSTAAFDKNPQSKERGITLDLGFSAVVLESPAQVKSQNEQIKQLQLTFVDCPGHASLIRTIIGGAQIIDLMLLVIDVQKGVQTQTAECVVIGGLLKRKLIVVINKIDLVEAQQQNIVLTKLEKKLRKALMAASFSENFPIFRVSAQTGQGIQELLNGMKNEIHIPVRLPEKPLVMYIDHCFSIRGQGTICTGTIVQGQLKINDFIELPAIGEQRKVKSLQMFKRPVQSATMGDRVGVCVTQFNAKQLERGILCQPGYIQTVYAAVILLERVKYYKFALKSKGKFHVSVGHDTVMARITLFKSLTNQREFNINEEYEYIDEIGPSSSEIQPTQNECSIFTLLEFERPVFAISNAILIASKLDLDAHSNCCRLAFWGNIKWFSSSVNYLKEHLMLWRIFKNKQKQGTVQRLLNSQEIIVQNLFKKDNNRELFVGKHVQLSTGETGIIASTFGQTSKVKITFSECLKSETLKILKEGGTNNILVILKYKKYTFNKNAAQTTAMPTYNGGGSCCAGAVQQPVYLVPVQPVVMQSSKGKGKKHG